MKIVRSQKGFIGIVVLALLGSLVLFFKAWFETETRKHVANQYLKIVAGQEQVFRSLGAYFAIICQQNSGFPTGAVTLDEMTTLGTYNPNQVLKPDHLNYELLVTRPTQYFDFNGRAVADGSTVFTLTYSARDERETALLAEAMSERRLIYAKSGNSFTITKEYQLNENQSNYYSLNGGGNGYQCK